MTKTRIPKRRLLAPMVAAGALASASHAAELSIERLFSPPSLAGPVIHALKISPDGRRITYLRGKSESSEQLDLWEYDVRKNQSRVLVDAHGLDPNITSLSDEEAARRERQRSAALSGIVEYSVAPSGHSLVFSLNGSLFYLDLTKVSKNQPAKIETHGFATDVTISPDGHMLAYVVDQNLITYDIATASTKSVTTDGGGTIKNGMAEFVAQEEMNRSTGYWWSPDGTRIAFARIDEQPVAIANRFEINADNVVSFQQRYPAAGGANALIRLGIADVRTGTVTWIDLGDGSDFYLARVNWLPDGNTLAVQRESRDQKVLDLLFADTGTGKTHVVLTETSDSWVELNNELTFLKRSNQFLWASARDGYKHLYLYRNDGTLVRQITSGEWNVDDFQARAVKAVDESGRLVYFTATKDGAIERQLYCSTLDGGDARPLRRITREPGLHFVTMTPDAQSYVDVFNSSRQPPQVSLHKADGTTIEYLLENDLDTKHPDAPFLTSNAASEFGVLEAADGQALNYRIFKPAAFDASKRYPAIVDVYGGPGTQRVLNNWAGSSFTQILTRAGYVVFQLDNRGSSGRGTAFQAPIKSRLGDVEVTDQVRGARWLAAQPFIDSTRIGVWGWSYGGYMTIMLMSKAPGVFRSGVSGAPVTDWLLYDTHYTERYLGGPHQDTAAYDSSSVMPYLKDLDGALLIIHGMADDNVLFSHSTKLFRKLQDLEKPFDVMVYPGAKHGLLRQRDGIHAYHTILNFFNRTLAAPIP